MWSNYFFTQQLFLHLQSPWHQLAPFPWEQFRQDDALWFSQLTGLLPLFFLFTFTHLLPFHHHLLRGWTNGGSISLKTIFWNEIMSLYNWFLLQKYKSIIINIFDIRNLPFKWFSNELFHFFYLQYYSDKKMLRTI